MTHALNILWDTTKNHWRRLVIWGLAFAVLTQVFMLIALIVRFQDLPNYTQFYDWGSNVAWIIQSTPSWSDIPPIIAEEWLIEIGFMNYDYGHGISEWSLNVIPSRMLVLFALGALVGLCLTLSQSRNCSLVEKRGLTAATGAGTILVAMTNATMSWVVCCAAPSWVVGLTMLGLGVSTSLAIQNFGTLISVSGFAVLGSLAFYLALSKSRLERTKRTNGVLSHA
ncbi:hypothetical protein [Pacificibacter sp. AS14]|uniref:hypothetical protein n=1 Tax=Pacificibacter sp. AS14 TaxID=3135785 RepID=UPI003174C291